MRFATYLVLAVCICLIIADGFYVRSQYTAHEADMQLPGNATQDLKGALQAIAALQRGSRHDDVLLQVRDALDQFPDAWQLYMARSQSLLHLGQAAAAIKDLNKVLAARPDLLQARADRARALRDRHQTDEALADITHILTLEPQHEDGLFLLGTIYYAQGKYESALEQFNLCLAAHPQSSATLYNRAQTYAELKQFDKARTDMEAFIQLTDNEQFRTAAREAMEQWK